MWHGTPGCLGGCRIGPERVAQPATRLVKARSVDGALAKLLEL